MDMHHYDVIVIGTGVAGQTAAEELAGAGRRVAVVECREIGGTCALRGCEPKKTLVTAAEVVERAAAQSGHGPAGALTLNWQELMAFKRVLTDPASAAIESAIESAGAEIVRGPAAFIDPATVRVGATSLTASDFVIATGARPRPLGIPGEELVLTSEHFLSADALGDRVVFIGGGYISFEFAHIAAAAGAAVTILHRGPRVLDGFDPDLADMLADGYRAAGIDVRVGAPVAAVERVGTSLEVLLGDGERVACDTVFHGAGRVPDLESLDPAAASVRYGPRGIEVDDRMRSTSNPHVWAAGDCAASGHHLTPVAIAQARVIVRNLLGNEPVRWAPGAIPSVVFSDPPMASVGLRLDEALGQGIEIESRLIDMSAWASARRVGARVSGARVLVESSTGRIVGAHLLSHNADEVINVFAAAMAGGLTAREMKAIPWTYPTGGFEIGYLI